MSNDLGDYQTPPELVARVLDVLARQGIRWTRVLEPTCGMGNFIVGALQHPALDVQTAHGIEIQAAHLTHAREQVATLTPPVHLLHDSIFSVDLRTLTWPDTGPLLILGNPPWVTNAALGAMASDNLPHKHNRKHMTGLDALTGKSNFDLAEAVILKLFDDLADQNPTIALLCKTSVARAILSFAAKNAVPIKRAALWHIDAKRWFNAAVDAGLLYIEIEAGHARYEMPVFASLDTHTPHTTIGVIDGQLVADVSTYSQCRTLDGNSSLTWRQGIKHDAAAIMELTRHDGDWVNKLGEVVHVEPSHRFPLLKSTDLFHGRTHIPRRHVIVTQHHLGEDTTHLQTTAPQLWAYLQHHATTFAQRKSSIYRNRPPFSMFGIGPYTFAPYKVAVSGLHKQPRFRLITPIGGQPVMLDDTGYFIPLQTHEQAALVVTLLTHPLAMAFFSALIFPDAKRPVTKKLLQRLDLAALLEHIGPDTAISRAQALTPTQPDWPQVIAHLFTPQSQQLSLL